MKKSQLRAISYAYSKRAREKREKYVIEREGSLDGFKASKYKNIHYYIINKYNVRVY